MQSLTRQAVNRSIKRQTLFFNREHLLQEAYYAVTRNDEEVEARTKMMPKSIVDEGTIVRTGMTLVLKTLDI